MTIPHPILNVYNVSIILIQKLILTSHLLHKDTVRVGGIKGDNIYSCIFLRHFLKKHYSVRDGIEGAYTHTNIIQILHAPAFNNKKKYESTDSEFPRVML